VGTSKPSVVETNVSQSAWSKASLAEVGLMAPSHERGCDVRPSYASLQSYYKAVLIIYSVFVPRAIRFMSVPEWPRAAPRFRRPSGTHDVAPADLEKVSDPSPGWGSIARLGGVSTRLPQRMQLMSAGQRS
jgi:hypothetical protein